MIAAALALGGCAPPARAQVGAALPKIWVESQRSVTVIGSSDSLRAVIGALCERSGIELKSYRAPDRPMSARYEAAPLRHVLERLLRQESFMLGFAAPDGGGEPELAWLSVIGTEAEPSTGAGAASDSSTTPAAPGTGLLPLTLMAQENSVARNASAMQWARRLDSEQAMREEFAKADVSVLAAELADYEHARAFLQTVRTVVRNAQARAKVNGLLARLR